MMAAGEVTVANGVSRMALNVLGMRNNSCRERIVEVLGQVEGVQDVSVSLVRARAVVAYEPPCEPATLIRAIEGVGYRASPDEGRDAP